MEAPRGLESEGRRAFDYAVATLTATGDDPSLYRDAIARYARASDMAATLRRAWVARGRPTIATGSRHNPIAHPFLREIADQERHVQTLAESLLLTPMARRKASRLARSPAGSLYRAGPAVARGPDEAARLTDRTHVRFLRVVT
jgi:hypothetical protein